MRQDFAGGLEASPIFLNEMARKVTIEVKLRQQFDL